MYVVVALFSYPWRLVPSSRCNVPPAAPDPLGIVPPALYRQVHKILLEARSKVFKALLNCSMRESREGRVVIKGIKVRRRRRRRRPRRAAARRPAGRLRWGPLLVAATPAPCGGHSSDGRWSWCPAEGRRARAGRCNAVPLMYGFGQP